MKTIITLHENEEYYVDKSYKLNYIVIKNIITSTASLYLDKKIKYVNKIFERNFGY